MKIIIRIDKALLTSIVAGFIVLGVAFSVAGAFSPQTPGGSNVKLAEAELSEVSGELTGSGETATFSISGMTCGSCVYRIKQALGQVDGVLSAEISLRQRAGVVEYDPTRVTPQQIAGVITQAGYPARQIDPSTLGAIQPSGGSGSCGGGGCGCGCGG
jgi:copper chaperone CopZ